MIKRKKLNRRKPQRLSQRLSETIQQERDHAKAVRTSFALLGTLAVFVCISLATWTASKLADPATLPIKHVKIEGDFRHLSVEALTMKVRDRVTKGFFTLDVDAIREGVMTMPWVRDATVRKLWPDAVLVKIEEQKPVVKWGERGYLNQLGELFEPLDQQASIHGLVSLSGPDGTHKMVYEKYRRLMSLLAEHEQHIKWLSLNERRGWQFGLLAGTTVVIGNADVDERIARFMRFVEPVMKSQASPLARVDLRYSNGFTVKYSHQQEEQPGVEQVLNGKAGSEGISG